MYAYIVYYSGRGDNNLFKWTKTTRIMKKRNPIEKSETIFETEHRLKREAKELAKKHKDVKPIKYLLK